MEIENNIMIKITFPDGSVREYEAGVNGLQIAESISQRLAQDVIACGVNGETTELNRPINQDATINLYKWDDAEGKHAFWHTSAHLMAEAIEELYPGTQFGIGPAIENGFYYDVMPPEGVKLSDADFPKIEQKMQELVQRKADQHIAYELIGESGPDHNKLFSFRVTINGESAGEGSGRTKKEAEQMAACEALRKLKA